MNAAVSERAAGVLLGAAWGDALGAGDEHAELPENTEPLEFRQGTLTGGPPGCWTDDTELTTCVADGLDEIAARFTDWYTQGPTDVGTTTALRDGARTADTMTAAAAAHQALTGHSGGNGALMRTGPVALPHLARGIAALGAVAAVADLSGGRAQPNPSLRAALRRYRP